MASTSTASSCWIEVVHGADRDEIQVRGLVSPPGVTAARAAAAPVRQEAREIVGARRAIAAVIEDACSSPC